MKQYRLRYAVAPPSDDPEGMFRVEAPDLPGCWAWGKTEEEAFENFRSVTIEFIASLMDHGDSLPSGVEVIESRDLVVV